MYRKSIFIFMVVLSFFLNCAMFSPKNFYFVVFEENPNIKNTKIYSKGIEIGKILDQDLSKANKLILTIAINSDYKDLIKSDTLFYADDNSLLLQVSDTDTQALPEKSFILGFASQTKLVWFKAKNTLNDFSKAAQEKIQKIIESFK
ncbi:MlaD family protein [Desulfobacter sp.]